jgi:hypothetical protein
MPYNLLMPEEEHRFLRARWLLVWQRRWWIALATLFILVWWLLPLLLYRHTGTPKDTKLKAITDTRTALLAGLIGVGALLTFWLNSRVYRITARTLEVTEQGQITERYTKAIEQLGNDKLDVRLGGIYALERIAVDSKRDHPTLVEVLSAFVREHSHHTHQESRPSQTTMPDRTIANVLAGFLRGRSEPAEVRQASPDRSDDEGPKPTTDVQAAITVLGRLPDRSGVSRGDLTRALLTGATFGEANLSGAMLGEVDLSAASLDGANLSGAWLSGANLSGAMLQGADLSGARLGLPHFWIWRARRDRLVTDGPKITAAVGITQAQLNTARGDAKTELPDELQRPDPGRPVRSRHGAARSWSSGAAGGPL